MDQETSTVGAELYLRHRNTLFKFRDVEADGNCMYYCLAKCPWSPPVSSTDEIRFAISQRMRAPSEELLNFFVEYHKSDENPQPSIDEWNDAVMTNSEWGSNFESSLFGLLYGVDVRIVTNSPSGLEESGTRRLLEMYQLNLRKLIPKDAPKYYLYLHKHNSPTTPTHNPNHFAILDVVDHEPPKGSIIYDRAEEISRKLAGGISVDDTPTIDRNRLRPRKDNDSVAVIGERGGKHLDRKVDGKQRHDHTASVNFERVQQHVVSSSATSISKSRQADTRTEKDNQMQSRTQKDPSIEIHRSSKSPAAKQEGPLSRKIPASRGQDGLSSRPQTLMARQEPAAVRSNPATLISRSGENITKPPTNTAAVDSKISREIANKMRRRDEMIAEPRIKTSRRDDMYVNPDVLTSFHLWDDLQKQSIRPTIPILSKQSKRRTSMDISLGARSEPSNSNAVASGGSSERRRSPRRNTMEVSTIDPSLRKPNQPTEMAYNGPTTNAVQRESDTQGVSGSTRTTQRSPTDSSSKVFRSASYVNSASDDHIERRGSIARSTTSSQGKSRSQATPHQDSNGQGHTGIGDGRKPTRSKDSKMDSTSISRSDENLTAVSTRRPSTNMAAVELKISREQANKMRRRDEMIAEPLIKTSRRDDMYVNPDVLASFHLWDDLQKQSIRPTIPISSKQSKRRTSMDISLGARSEPSNSNAVASGGSSERRRSPRRNTMEVSTIDPSLRKPNQPTEMAYNGPTTNAVQRESDTQGVSGSTRTTQRSPTDSSSKVFRSASYESSASDDHVERRGSIARSTTSSQGKSRSQATPNQDSNGQAHTAVGDGRKPTRPKDIKVDKPEIVCKASDRRNETSEDRSANARSNRSTVSDSRASSNNVKSESTDDRNPIARSNRDRGSRASSNDVKSDSTDDRTPNVRSNRSTDRESRASSNVKSEATEDRTGIGRPNRSTASSNVKSESTEDRTEIARPNRSTDRESRASSNVKSEATDNRPTERPFRSSAVMKHPTRDFDKSLQHQSDPQSREKVASTTAWASQIEDARNGAKSFVRPTSSTTMYNPQIVESETR